MALEQLRTLVDAHKETRRDIGGLREDLRDTRKDIRDARTAANAAAVEARHVADDLANHIAGIDR
jgi:hypothetical protein